MELGEIIGEGQFGNVHKGSYKGRDNQTIAVAVKTCKVDADLATSEKFLEEACKSSSNLQVLNLSYLITGASSEPQIR